MLKIWLEYTLSTQNLLNFGIYKLKKNSSREISIDVHNYSNDAPETWPYDDCKNAKKYCLNYWKYLFRKILTRIPIKPIPTNNRLSLAILRIKKLIFFPSIFGFLQKLWTSSQQYLKWLLYTFRRRIQWNIIYLWTFIIDWSELAIWRFNVEDDVNWQKNDSKPISLFEANINFN